MVTTTLGADSAALGDFAGLARLRRGAAAGSPQATREVAQQFEAVFIGMMLKSMRAATPGDSLVDSDASRMARDLYDQQLAADLAKKGTFGVARMLLRQLDPQAAGAEPVPSGDGVAPALDGNALAALRRIEGIRRDADLDAATPASSLPAAFKPGTPDAFVREVWPHAQAAAGELGVRPEVLVAQAALESGWGRSVPRHADGRSSHNLFGIKADRSWNGARVENSTLEYVDGVPQRQVDGFRAYASWGESFRDYARFIQQNPRYKQALENAADSSAYLHELHRAGYATDPAYPAKIQRILGSDALAEFLQTAAVKSAPRG